MDNYTLLYYKGTIYRLIILKSMEKRNTYILERQVTNFRLLSNKKVGNFKYSFEFSKSKYLSVITRNIWTTILHDI